MKLHRLAYVALFAILSSSWAVGQHETEPIKPGSTAPRDTWKGVVKSLDNSTGTITLEYKHKDKVETFTGILKAPVMVIDVKGAPAPPPIKIQMGDRLLVHYYKEGAKYSSTEGGKRHDEVAKANLIVQINFVPEKEMSSGY
jgi:hypothetical protein